MFEKIAPYLKDPLILVGFFLFLALLFLRSLVKKGIIPTLQQEQGFSILKLILLYGFIIGLLLIGLGFGLKYRELSEKEQDNIVNMLSKEFEGNISVIGELKENTTTFLNGQITISKALRTDGIKILPIMFPEENLDLSKDVNPNELARKSFLKIIEKNYASDASEMTKLDDFSKALSKTIKSVMNTNESLRDSSRIRYMISTDIWNNNLSVFKKINLIDVSQYQRAYKEEQNIRNDYDVVCKAAIDFQKALLEYFRTDNELTWEQLAHILTLERQSYDLIVAYSKNIVNAITDLQQIQKQLVTH